VPVLLLLLLLLLVPAAVSIGSKVTHLVTKTTPTSAPIAGAKVTLIKVPYSSDQQPQTGPACTTAADGTCTVETKPFYTEGRSAGEPLFAGTRCCLTKPCMFHSTLQLSYHAVWQCGLPGFCPCDLPGFCVLPGSCHSYGSTIALVEVAGHGGLVIWDMPTPSYYENEALSYPYVGELVLDRRVVNPADKLHVTGNCQPCLSGIAACYDRVITSFCDTHLRQWPSSIPCFLYQPVGGFSCNICRYKKSAVCG
jgi:hypothetical protein